MEDELSELLPCPWCENNNLRIAENIDFSKSNANITVSVYQIVCRTCSVRGPMMKNKPLAITAWNNFAKSYNAVELYRFPTTFIGGNKNERK